MKTLFRSKPYSFAFCSTQRTMSRMSRISSSISASGLNGAVVTVYKCDGTTVLGTVASGSAEALTILAVPGDIYLCVSGAAGEVTLTLGHEVPPACVYSNKKGLNGENGVITTIEEGAGWVEDANHEGVMKSDIEGKNYGRAHYSMTVTVAGTVSFEWASSGESRYDYLQVFVNGVEKIGQGSNRAPVSSFEALTWFEFSQSLNAGDTITISVSQGPDEIDMPNVVGSTKDAAVAELQSKGFTVTINEEDKPEAAGTVVGQNPVAGTKLSSGSAVIIAISTGQVQVTAPDVRGMDPATAVAILQAAGFKGEMKQEPREGDYGKVVSTTLIPGTQYSSNTGITIYVGNTPPVDSSASNPTPPDKDPNKE